MPLSSVSLVALATITLLVAGRHLLLHVRRRTPWADLALGILSLVITLHCITGALDFTAATSARALLLLRITLCLTALMGPLSVWFLAERARIPDRRLPAALGAAYVLLHLAAALDPAGTAISGPPHLVDLPLPAGGAVSAAMVGSPFQAALTIAAILIVVPWCLRTALLSDRTRCRPGTMPLTPGVALIGLAAIADLAISLAWRGHVHLAEYAWLVVLLPLGWELTGGLATMARTEAALRDADARFAGLLSACPLGVQVYRCTPDGRLLLSAANPVAAEVLGREGAEFLGLPIEQTLPHPAEAADLEAFARMCHEGPTGARLSHRARETGPAGAFDLYAFGLEPGAVAVMFEDVTNRVQTQEALRHSEGMLRSLFRVAPTAIGLTNQRRLVWVNDRLCEMLGYRAHELEGRGARVLYPSDEEYEWVGKAKYAQIARQGTGTVETRWVCKDGTVLDVLLSSTTVAVDQPQGDVIFTALDITDRKRAEDMARLDESRLEALLVLNQMAEASVPDITSFAMDEAVRLTRSTIGYVVLVAEDEQDLDMYAWSTPTHRHWPRGAVPVTYAPAEAGLWGEVLRLRRPYVTDQPGAEAPEILHLPDCDTPVERHLGVPVVVDGRVVVVAGVAGKPAAYDATDLRQLELLMNSVWGILQRRGADLERARLASAVEHAADAISITDAGWVVQYVNSAFECLTGYSAQEAVGLTADFLCEPEGQAAMWAEVSAHLASGGTWSGRAPCRRRDGSQIIADTTVSSIRGADGALVGYVSARRDVTDAVRAEDRLRESQRLEAVGQLAAGVAHEFNNLLAAMMMRAERAGLVGTEEAFRQLVELVLRQTARGADLCRNLTTFARPSSSRRVPTTVEPCIDSALGMAQHHLDAHEITSDLSFATGGARAMADPGQLEQVLLNLIINACHAMAQGGTLRIATRLQEDHAASWIAITVADTGTGIAPEALPRIFEPFFTTKGRLGESRTPGTGLGLSVTHGIVKAHGGTITVESTVGVGTTFTIALPVHTP